MPDQHAAKHNNKYKAMEKIDNKGISVIEILNINNAGGWIKIVRDIRNHWIWQDPKRLQWWIDLLFMASFEDSKILINGQLVEIHRGQLIWSQRSLAKKWMTTPKTVRKFLRLLESEQMLDIKLIENGRHQNAPRCPRLTICNYDKYQRVVPVDGLVGDPLNDQQRRIKELKKKNTMGFLTHSEGKKQVNGYESFIDNFNSVKKSRFAYKDSKSRRQFLSLIHAGYSSEQMIKALQNFMRDQYHIDTGFKHLTPEFITRSDKIEKGLNMNCSAKNGTVDFF